MGITIGGVPHFNKKTILHSGNVGEYNAGGIASGVATDDYLQGRVAKAWYDWNTNTGNGISEYSYGIYVGAYDTGYGMQLATTIGSVSFLRARVKRNSAWDDWKTIAFTDSDITGNAATATKLKNSVTLWGNTFDGTKDLSGIIKLPSGRGIRWMLGEVELDNISVGTMGAFNLGYGSAINGYASYINGTPIYFRTGKDSPTTAMTITDEGNVLVNHYDLEGVKFAVKGRVHIGDISVNAIALGHAPEYGLTLGIANLGMAQWVSTSGAGNIQSMAFNSATAYALNLNPLGGAVNVGEGGLNVAGKTILGKIVAFTTGETYYERAGANYLWANKGGYLVMGVGANAGPLHAALSIYNNVVRPGDRNNEVSLGASSYRWSNVYSTLGNFSSRVLIGGITDDETSALQVKGAIKSYSSANDLKLYTRISGSSVQVGRTSSSYTGGYNCGLQLGEDNTNIGYIAGCFNDKGVNQTNFFYGGQDAATAPFVISIHDDITYLRSSRTIIRYALEVNSTANFGGLSTFNAGITIPSGKSITFVDANGNNHVLS